MIQTHDLAFREAGCVAVSELALNIAVDQRDAADVEYLVQLDADQWALREDAWARVYFWDHVVDDIEELTS